MLGIFPVILLGLRYQPALVLVPSALIYAAVQVFGFPVPAYPEGHVWYFNPLAWQFLFVAGAALGHRGAQAQPLPRGLMRVGFPIAAAIFVTALVIKVTWTVHGVSEPLPD